jgi:hypothetical protein
VSSVRFVARLFAFCGGVAVVLAVVSLSGLVGLIAGTSNSGLMTITLGASLLLNVTAALACFVAWALLTGLCELHSTLTSVQRRMEAALLDLQVRQPAGLREWDRGGWVSAAGLPSDEPDPGVRGDSDGESLP